jgi:hypothetical protein
VSGLSVGPTRVPSKRNRTLEMFLPWRSQKAFMSLPSCVVRLILKKTSLLLSVTLMFKCSEGPASSGFWAGEPLSDMVFERESGSRLWRCECAVVGGFEAAQGYFSRQWAFEGGRSGEQGRRAAGNYLLYVRR